MLSILKRLGAVLPGGNVGSILVTMMLISFVGHPVLAQHAGSKTSVSHIQLAQLASSEDEKVEIEFWQSVKASKYIQEFEAYLGAYPNGKFAPLARIRIRQLIPKPGKTPPPKTVTRPVQPQKTTPPPAVFVAPKKTIPQFKIDPKPVALSNADCRMKLGRYGIAEADSFSRSGSTCACLAPYQISVGGENCIRPFSVTVIPRQRPRPSIVEVNLQPDREISKRRAETEKETRSEPKRKSKKRPGKARGRAIANRYCRRRYGSSLTNVVVKKSKFYCHYKVDAGGDGFVGVKKIKFKNL